MRKRLAVLVLATSVLVVALGFGGVAVAGGDALTLDNVPTGISLSSNLLAGGKPAGTTVGTLSTTDADGGEYFT